MPVVKPQALFEDRVAAIKGMEVERAEVDVSGGLDSFVVLGLAVAALGPENVTAVYSDIHSSDDSRRRAHLAAKAFGVPLNDLTLGPWADQLIRIMHDAIERAYGHEELDRVLQRCKEDPTIEGSIRSCLRAPVGRGMNRLMCGGIRHGTGNEDEDRIVRFYQKGGDGEVDTNPCAFLSKGEMYQLALYIGQRFNSDETAREIITARPTPDLWANGEGHNDEDEYSSWLGVELPEGLTWYSYIDPDTGEYTHVGILERVARLDDLLLAGDYTLFSNKPGLGLLAAEWDAIIREARAFFTDYPSFPYAKVKEILGALRKAERITRHKMNPNCPSLGSRSDLVANGILTDDLPL